MRHLVLVALLAPACASAPTAPAPVLASHAAPTAEPVELVADADYHPPYALLFHEGQKWDFSVRLASTAVMSPINCEVEHIEYMCDRRVSNIKCSDGNRVVAGTYTANMQGMWREGFADATAELDENTRAFERVPQPNMHTTRHGKAWCSTDGGTTLCVEDGKGLVGASMLSTTGEEMIVGVVPSAA